MIPLHLFQLIDITGKDQDESMIALHDCNGDVNRAINVLLEGSPDTVSKSFVPGADSREISATRAWITFVRRAELILYVNRYDFSNNMEVGITFQMFLLYVKVKKMLKILFIYLFFIKTLLYFCLLLSFHTCIIFRMKCPNQLNV